MPGVIQSVKKKGLVPFKVSNSTVITSYALTTNALDKIVPLFFYHKEHRCNITLRDDCTDS